MSGNKDFSKAELKINDQFIELSAKSVSISIDKNLGYISQVYTDNLFVPFGNGPELCEGNYELIGWDTSIEDNKAVYIARYKGNLREIKWIMHPNGIVQLIYKYVPNNHQPFYGVNFSFPEEIINGIKYLGKGPYRVWKNRMKGATLNVWEKPYNNTITGESFLYPEFKGYHADLYWVKIANEIKDFAIISGTNDLFFRLYSPEKHIGDERNTQVEFPSGDISFLHGISPIGTKFKKPNQLGPQSQLNQYSRHWTDNILEINLLFDFR